MISARDNLIAWLRDAHAMEQQAKSLLETQINRLENYPEALPRMKDHLRETDQQMAEVEQCLKKLGSDTSSVKDMGSSLMANMQGMMHMMSGDEIVKHAVANHAFERFEAACYHSIAEAAEDAGEPEIARTAKAIEGQEIRMADWVWDTIPAITKKYVERSATDQPAKI